MPPGYVKLPLLDGVLIPSTPPDGVEWQFRQSCRLGKYHGCVRVMLKKKRAVASAVVVWDVTAIPK